MDDTLLYSKFHLSQCLSCAVSWNLWHGNMPLHSQILSCMYSLRGMYSLCLDLFTPSTSIFAKYQKYQRHVLWSGKKDAKNNVLNCAQNLCMNSSENEINYGNIFFSLSLPWSKYACTCYRCTKYVCTKYACTCYPSVRTLEILSGLGLLGFSCSC